MTTASEVVEALKLLASEDHFQKLVRFGINDTNALGVKIPHLRQVAKELGKDHKLAAELWSTGLHEARILASFVEDPKQINSDQMDRWVFDFDSWDLCDQCCTLFVRTPFVEDKIDVYLVCNQEFVRRAAFVLICEQAIHNKRLKDEHFGRYFEMIEKYAFDDRNFVRKAVNWALRQIGKRNESLRLEAIECAEKLLKQGAKSATWIAKDALRELTSAKTIQIVERKENKKGMPGKASPL